MGATVIGQPTPAQREWCLAHILRIYRERVRGQAQGRSSLEAVAQELEAEIARQGMPL